MSAHFTNSQNTLHKLTEKSVQKTERERETKTDRHNDRLKKLRPGQTDKKREAQNESTAQLGR